MAGLRKRRFDGVEMAAVGFLAAICAFCLALELPRRSLTYADYTVLEEANRLKAKYGPGRYSEHEEEWIIRDYFKDLRRGFFVDVGANDPRRDSNTFYLEEHLGWSGVALDPQREFAPAYRQYRPHTTFLPVFVSDTSDVTTTLYKAGQSTLTVSSSAQFTSLFGDSLKKLTAPTATLTQLLAGLEVRHIDLLSIDVELAEPHVLRGFDIDRFRPALVCIEAHPSVRQIILEYFARHKYVVVGQYLRVDTSNLYFKPLEE